MPARLDPETRRLLDHSDSLLIRSREVQTHAGLLSRHLAEVLRQERPLAPTTTSELSEPSLE